MSSTDVRRAYTPEILVPHLYGPLAQAIADRYRENDLDYGEALALLERIPRG